MQPQTRPVLINSTQEPVILIVDDQEANLRLLDQLLRRQGYKQCFCLQDSRHVIAHFKNLHPDIILLDLHMPHLDGYEVLSQLGVEVPPDEFLPVLVLTADALPAAKQRALSLGATDFLSKPFDTTEVSLRIRNLLRTRFLHLEISSHNRVLGEKVEQRTQALEDAQVEMLERLASASDSRDDDTGEHTHRVGALAAALSVRAGWPGDKLSALRRAAALHDIGKIAIPDRILLKAGALDPDEFAVMKTHTSVGARILAGSRFSMIRLAEEIAHYHHERWDGGGYFSCTGAQIPLSARIVAIADVFDVLTHSRPYKRAWTTEDALDLIRRESGRHFDPDLVERFLELVQSSDLAFLESSIASLSPSESYTEPVVRTV
jgi:putative two-component system response regulator